MDLTLAWAAGTKHKIQQKRSEWEWLLTKCEQHNVESVLEIGCFSGGSTFSFATFAKRLITIDRINPPKFNISNITCSYDYVAGNSRDPNTVNRVSDLIGDDKVDLLFIDGSHSYEGVKSDFELYKKFASKLIGFHDIVDSASHRRQGCFVSQFWNEVKLHYPNDEIIERHNWGGIGILEV